MDTSRCSEDTPFSNSEKETEFFLFEPKSEGAVHVGGQAELLIDRKLLASEIFLPVGILKSYS